MENGPSGDFDAFVPDVHFATAVAGLRGLGSAGLRVLAIAPGWTGAGLWSRYAQARTVGPDVAACQEDAARHITALLEHHGPAVIYPSREEGVELALDLQGRLGPNAIRPFPAGAPTQRLREKGALFDLAAEVGLAAPSTLAEASAAELLRSAPQPPFVLKPAGPVSGLGTAKLVCSREQLVATLGPLDPDEQLLVQERIHGPIVSVELVLDRSGRTIARFQHLTSRTWPAAAGSVSLAASVEPDDALVERAAAMLSKVGYWGLAQMDFVQAAKGHVLLDINPRFYRCLPLALACGMNLPAAWHAAATGSAAALSDAYRVGVTYRWLEADIVAAAQGSPRRLLYRAPRPAVGGMWARDDPIPSVILAARGVGVRLRRRFPLQRRSATSADRMGAA